MFRFSKLADLQEPIKIVKNCQKPIKKCHKTFVFLFSIVR